MKYDNGTTFFLLTFILTPWRSYIVGGNKVKNFTRAVTRQIRSVGFPEGSGMGLFFAVSIPLDIPNKAVSVSFYFEANYILPGEKKSVEFAENFGERSNDRRLAYEILENKLIRAGYPGRVCLMRAICDASKKSVTGNGLLGDLLHILLTPSSSSSDENIDDEIKVAESEKNCDEKYDECPIRVLDLISHYIR